MHRFPNGIEIEDVADGMLVRQGAEAYVARNWQLSAETRDLIEAALSAGLGCMIRDDHPRRNARLPNTRGVVYIAFSPTSDVQWSLAVDTFNPRRGDFGACAFNGKYRAQFEARGIPFKFEARNKGAGHMMVARDHVFSTISELASCDHSVLALNRKTHDGVGFTTEYVLQREILKNWSSTPWAERYDVVQDEFPVDGGLTSRRIDILARDRQTGDWLIIELKRAEAPAAAVEQVENYLAALAKRDDFNHGRLDGALVAERIPEGVRDLAQNSGVAAYEAVWPLSLHRV